MQEVTFKQRYMQSFSEDIPVIKTSLGQLEKIDENRQELLELLMNNNPPFNHFLLEVEEWTLEGLTVFEYENKGDGILSCKFGMTEQNTKEVFPFFSWEHNFKKDTYSKLQINKKLYEVMTKEEVLELTQEMFSEKVNMYSQTINIYVIVSGYLLSKERTYEEKVYKESKRPVSTVKKSNIDSTSKQNRIIDLTKNARTIIYLNDDYNKTNNRRKCEYQFTRRGHWAHSKKTGNKWWVRESKINKDKPKKQSTYKL